jgi:dephospho-CoA kinase
VLTVGLTGGIASGKSTVGRWLEELGCLVSDADRLVAELYQPGAAGTAAVREIFSKDVLDPRGAVDKPKLAELVFNDQPALRKLEAAIHPLVGQAYAALVEDADGIVVFEAPLLVETGGAERYDVLVTVEADAKRRLERAIARGVDAKSARARIRQQTDSASRMARADFVLHNDGTLDELRAQVEELVAELEHRLAAS